MGTVGGGCCHLFVPVKLHDCAHAAAGGVLSCCYYAENEDVGPFERMNDYPPNEARPGK